MTLSAKSKRTIILRSAGSLMALTGTLSLAQQPAFEALYAESCSACHGARLEGSPTGAALNGSALLHGSTLEEISRNIASGFPQAGMPAMVDSLNEGQIRGLAIYIVEQRSKLSYADFKLAAPLEIPAAVQSSEVQDFRIETLATGLDPFPFSIAPLPDGSILLTEKTKGLSIVSPAGVKSALIEGAPQAYDDSIEVPGLQYIVGTGWLMDVAVDPDYADNGWVYLLYGDRCSDCNAVSRDTQRPVSMNKLVRGRIRDGRWVDEQVLWQADIEQYTWMVDQAAGGRVCFDDTGHVYISVGMKGTSNYDGIQDLSKPYGKILRLNRDGSIPQDNPFVGRAGALTAIWTYGHRNPQGLEFDRETGELWGTEMGPRGGDEVNLLLPGRNYGWPLVSKGINYDGTEVDYGKNIGIERDMDAIEQPVVDLTPAPAVSSFIFYEGDRFPGWRHNMLVGTLKATDLYRFVLQGDQIIHRETVLEGVGRIRDIEAAPDGSILLLIEHLQGGRILRLVPAG
jgi:glucose/arabinose dehydrogenase/cytochrome c5